MDNTGKQAWRITAFRPSTGEEFNAGVVLASDRAEALRLGESLRQDPKDVLDAFRVNPERI